MDTAQEAIRCGRGRLHTPPQVYGQMMIQVMIDYSCLPDPNIMPLSDIVYFYDMRRKALRDATKPK